MKSNKSVLTRLKTTATAINTATAAAYHPLRICLNVGIRTVATIKPEQVAINKLNIIRPKKWVFAPPKFRTIAAKKQATIGVGIPIK